MGFGVLGPAPLATLSTVVFEQPVARSKASAVIAVGILDIMTFFRVLLNERRILAHVLPPVNTQDQLATARADFEVDTDPR